METSKIMSVMRLGVVCWALCVALAALCVQVSAPAAAQQKTSVALASASVNYAPYFIALEKGYYKEEGFNVEIVKATGGAATAALMSGDIPFSTSGAAAMSAIMKGAPMKLIFFPWDRPTFQIWATDPKIKTLEDLKGKAIGIQSRGDTFEIALRMVLMQNGIDPNGISYTALGHGSGRFASILSGSLPSAMISRIDVEKLREMGALEKAHMVYDLYETVHMPFTGLAVADSAIQKDRDRVKRFVRASLKGFIYSATFKEETIDITTKYNEGAATRDIVAKNYDEVLASKSEDGTVPLSAMQTEIEVRGQIMDIPRDKLPKVEKVFDLSMAEEVNRELKAVGWKPTP